VPATKASGTKAEPQRLRNTGPTGRIEPLPRKRIAELYTLGYTKHGKTELYRDLLRHVSEASDEPFVVSRGQRGLVMSVFDLPSYPFVFTVIKDRFPPQKTASREKVRRLRPRGPEEEVGREWTLALATVPL
jgi:isocitrate dehydrogenase kinase/phosphatase